MHKRESKIFGSTEKKSKISIFISANNIETTLSDFPEGKRVKERTRSKTFSINILDYLAYGLHEYNKQIRRPKYKRKNIQSGTHFNLTFRFKKEVKDELFNAISALFMLGGLGACSRNGFGSLYSSQIDKIEISKLFQGELKSFTSFSRKAEFFDTFNEHLTWEGALSEIGIAYRNARRSLEGKHKFDKRSLIAKPVESKLEKNIPDYIRNGRIAKPYFLHVSKIGKGRYQGHILFLPHKYKGENHNPSDPRGHEEYLKVCYEMNKSIKAQMEGSF